MLVALPPEWVPEQGVVAMLLAIAPADVVFSGFASSAFWIIFGGLILGMSIRHTGLGEHLAGRVLLRLPIHYAWGDGSDGVASTDCAGRSGSPGV